MKTYNIRTTRPSPSMNQDKQIILALDYDDAVIQTQMEWKKTGRHTSLSSGEYGIQVWHSISYDGIATDKNNNSKIPQSEQLTR